MTLDKAGNSLVRCPRFKKSIIDVRCSDCAYYLKRRCAYGFRLSHMHKGDMRWIREVRDDD